MVKLLVSVRNAAEAREAIAGGANWIDVKEPAAGSLGRPKPDILQGVVECVAGRLPVSTALGELREQPGGGRRNQIAWPGIAWAKVGLSGCGAMSDWPVRLRSFRDRLPLATSLVAVVYADSALAEAPSADEVLQVACDLGLRALLVDTYDKSAGGLFNWFSPTELGDLFAAAHQAGMLAVAAGSLRQPQLRLAIDAGADVIAVRGAACLNQHREARICRHHVMQLQTAIRRANVEFS